MLSPMFAAKPGRAGTAAGASPAEIQAFRGLAQPERVAFAADLLLMQKIVSDCPTVG
jgi:hypothetical protein